MVKQFKILISCLVFLFISTTISWSQFTKNDRILSAGISASSYGRYFHNLPSYKESLFIPVYIQYENGLNEGSFFAEYSKYLTSGSYLGFARKYYSKDIFPIDNSPAYSVYRSYAYLSGGLLLSFHYTPLLEELDLSIDPKQFDLFLTLRAGVNLEFFKSDFDQDPNAFEVQQGTFKMTDLNTFFYLAPTLGGRYYFTDKLAVQLELGYFNLGKLSVGLSYNL